MVQEMAAIPCAFAATGKLPLIHLRTVILSLVSRSQTIVSFLNARGQISSMGTQYLVWRTYHPLRASRRVRSGCRLPRVSVGWDAVLLALSCGTCSTTSGTRTVRHGNKLEV